MPNGRLVLYLREACHLCEDVSVMLDEMVGADGYLRVDIDGDDALVERYGHRIPVLALDGVDRLEVPISAPELRDLVGGLHRR